MIIILLISLILSMTTSGCAEADWNISNPQGTIPEIETDMSVASVPLEGAGAAGGTLWLKVGTGKSLSTLTPFATKVAGEISEEAIYEKLGILDRPGGDLVGVLAKNWETIDDGTTWDVEIYDYIYDSEGNHITAEDVSFCYNKRIGIAQMTKCLACETVSDYTVRITLNSNDAGTLNAVMNGVDIVSMKAYESSADGMANDPVGTGPYVVEEYVPGSYITLIRNARYWQKDETLKSYCANATIEKISFIEISGAEEQRMALESGAIDCMDTIDPTEVSVFEGNTDYSIREIVAQQFFMISFSGDESSSTANDINLRFAIAYAIDSAGIVERALGGRGQAIRYLAMPGFPDAPTEPEQYFEYDPEYVKYFLEQSDYDQQTIRIACQDIESYPAVAKEVSFYLEEAGIKTEVEAYDPYVWQRIYNDPSKYDLVITEIGAFDYLSAAWQTPFSTNKSTGKSKAGWDNPQLKVLIDEVRREDPPAREKHEALQNLINENMYALGLLYRYSYSIWNNNVHIIDVPQGCRSEMLWWCAVTE